MDRSPPQLLLLLQTGWLMNSQALTGLRIAPDYRLVCCCRWPVLIVLFTTLRLPALGVHVLTWLAWSYADTALCSLVCYSYGLWAVCQGADVLSTGYRATLCSGVGLSVIQHWCCHRLMGRCMTTRCGHAQVWACPSDLADWSLKYSRPLARGWNSFSFISYTSSDGYWCGRFVILQKFDVEIKPSQ